MILVGLTGGVATGKSTVARLFRDCGAAVIDADVLARAVVEPGKPAWRAIVRTYGKDVLLEDGTINRQALGRLVFRDPAKRRTLNAIIHPRVAREQARRTRVLAERQPAGVILYDVPLLFEASIDNRVDRIIVVTADRETQIARLRERNGLSRSEAVRRIRSQLPLSRKIARADYVIDGTRPLGEIREQVRRIYGALKQAAEEHAAVIRLRRRRSSPRGAARSARTEPSNRDARLRRTSRAAAHRRAESPTVRGT